ncbi:hypothetical protein SDRG_05469 [Saprolegnia diclina VS20]|uniref:Transmembrane protein 198 n=1 Tax=Saprolegnia diclina (strain VS20) TaxID=1156394 RepID=T0QGZ4_SAPDV|nr:hypothetical protein SDRG_05469 [Saprolegnia diclina VS20]EQC37244.1 hypothetical protein SDRG_05469 [Saprolegnia diclina VS20]|eukprot:XP_008609406.1 hypothetical protein SDRG_05469 [Saprolegnia diclina VS20]
MDVVARVLFLGVAASGAVNLTIDGSSSFDKTTNHIVNATVNGDLPPSILAGVGIGLGLIVALAGYRLFRPVLFVSGFGVGAVLAYLLAEAIFTTQSYATTAHWVCFVAGGLIVGATVVCLWRTGLFVIGAAAGVLLAFVVNTSFGYKLWPSNPSGMLYVLIAIFGLAGALLARCLERPFLIVATSLAGAVACLWGVGYFAGGYPSGNHLEALRNRTASGDYTYDIGSAWWGYMAGTLVLFGIGTLVQFRKTAMGWHHAPAASDDSAYVGCSSPVHGRPIQHSS